MQLLRFRAPTRPGWTALVAASAIAILTLGFGVPALSSSDGYRESEVVLQSSSGDDLGLDHGPHLEGVLEGSGDDHLLATPQMDASFDLVGLLWESGEPEEVFVRVRDAAGAWSTWYELGQHPSPEDETRGSDPIWARDSTGFQFAIDGNVSGVRVGLYEAPAQSGAAAVPQPGLAATGPDGVHSRSEWDSGNDCRPDGEPFTFSDVQGIVVHHTVSAASSQADVPSAIDAICNFHVNGRGWSDIGYNAIVDPYGGIWEGRTGGLEAGISGAHSAGFNTLTQGVAMLGDYSSSTFPIAQENALVELLDWMTGWYFIDPDADVTLYSRSDGPKFDEGESVTLPSIMGHRDLGVTSCPGDAGYARLPAIRSAVVPIPRPTSTSAGEELLTYSSFTGRLRFESITGLGAYSSPVRWGSVSTGWTSVEAIELTGDDHHEIQFYNSTTGRVVFHELNSDGSLGTLIRLGTLGTGWTTMEPADTEGDGDDELFFYRESDGRFGFYQVGADGLLGSGIRSGYFGAGWTAIEPLDIDGDGKDEMMFYRKSDGRFAFYNLTSSGFIGSAIRVSNFGPGWDLIEPIDTNATGDDELLFYRHSDGRYAYYDLNTGGFIGANLSVGNYPDQWTSISSPELD
jgi:hypothetical protein